MNCNCDINWENTKILAVEPIWFRRKVREALEIRRLKTGPSESKGLNRDLGDYVVTTTQQGQQGERCAYISKSDIGLYTLHSLTSYWFLKL